MKQDEVLAYARKIAGDLRSKTVARQTERGTFWAVSEPDALPYMQALTTSALEFLRVYAGGQSYWTKQAVERQSDAGRGPAAGARMVADLLLTWADHAEAGIAEVAGARARAEIAVASTDLMESVRRLNEDRASHPAAAIVLCGAALEIALRSTIEACDLTMPERLSISSCAGVLRGADLLSKQEVKDIEMCGGMRNQAAHGDLASLSRERAGLMEQMTNLLLARLVEIQS